MFEAPRRAERVLSRVQMILARIFFFGLKLSLVLFVISYYNYIASKVVMIVRAKTWNLIG